MTIFNDNLLLVSYYAVEETIFNSLPEELLFSLSRVIPEMESETRLLQKIEMFSIDLKRNLLDGQELINSILAVFTESIVIGFTPENSYNFHVTLFDYSLNIPFPNTTIPRQQVLINIALFQQSVNLYTFSNALAILPTLTFDNNEDIIQKISELSKQFDLVITNNTFVQLNNEVLELVTISSDLLNMFDITIKFLKDLQVSLPKQETVFISRNSLIPLVYSYYGDLKLLNTLAKLNKVTNPLTISGDFKVLVS